jgi:hypothetical protein
MTGTQALQSSCSQSNARAGRSRPTVSEATAELSRRGLDPDDRITITIEPDELIPGRRASRPRVIAAGLTDDDIDRLIGAGTKGSRAACSMRVVLDTNVLVSAALKRTSMPGMAALMAERRGGLLKPPTEEQLFAVISRPYLEGMCH